MSVSLATIAAPFGLVATVLGIVHAVMQLSERPRLRNAIRDANENPDDQLLAESKKRAAARLTSLVVVPSRVFGPPFAAMVTTVAFMTFGWLAFSTPLALVSYALLSSVSVIGGTQRLQEAYLGRKRVEHLVFIGEQCASTDIIASKNHVSRVYRGWLCVSRWVGNVAILGMSSVAGISILHAVDPTLPPHISSTSLIVLLVVFLLLLVPWLLLLWRAGQRIRDIPNILPLWESESSREHQPSQPTPPPTGILESQLDGTLALPMPESDQQPETVDKHPNESGTPEAGSV